MSDANYIGPPPTEEHCSFCGRPKSACKRLLGNADGSVHICDVCIRQGKERLKEPGFVVPLYEDIKA